MNYKDKFKQHNDREIEKKQPKLDFSMRLEFKKREVPKIAKKAINFSAFLKISVPTVSLACVVLICAIAFTGKQKNASEQIGSNQTSNPQAANSAVISASNDAQYSYVPSEDQSSGASGSQESNVSDHFSSLAPSKSQATGMVDKQITVAGSYRLVVESGDASKIVVYKMIDNGYGTLIQSSDKVSIVADSSGYTMTLEVGTYRIFQENATSAISFKLVYID